MFLESSYQPKQPVSDSSLSIMDVAILTAQIGDRPFYKKGLTQHLTVGQMQLVCYYAQGIHIATMGRSLFKDDFYIVENRIENPRITEVFGEYDKTVTPFTMDKSMERFLATRDNGFTAENNLLTQEVIYKYAPCNYKETMKELRETEPYIKALSNELNRIDKNDIKDYFEHLLIKSTVFTDLILGE